MNGSRSILCPVDFSDASAGALRYAAAIASRLDVRLIVLTVEDALLTEAVDLGTGVVWGPEECQADLAAFAAETLVGAAFPGDIHYEVAVGKPAREILRVSREQDVALTVMSTHGLTGMRKLFFGSTTEGVLRETNHPVLVTPPVDPGPVRFEEAKRLIRRLLLPVDLSPASRDQIAIAQTLCEALGVSLIVAHTIEPVKSRLAARLHLTGIEANRRSVAEERLNELIAPLPPQLHAEALLAYGDPAEELVKIARDRDVGLIMVGLHGSPLLGPRMGSVTYRLLCLSPVLVLAVPPNGSAGTRAVNAPLHDVG
jgi:nucleotide-binding universal stress UspA family protein